MKRKPVSPFDYLTEEEKRSQLAETLTDLRECLDGNPFLEGALEREKEAAAPTALPNAPQRFFQ